MGLIGNFLLQFLLTVGMTVAFGLIIWALKKIFYKLAGSYARVVCIVTGIIGTPVHELGHAFFCLPFGHKITEIKLFQPDSADGVLGYVKHTYNKKNVYHQIGNFFISFGPIIFGSGVLVLLTYLLVPDLWLGLQVSGYRFAKINFNASIVTLTAAFDVLGEMITIFFDKTQLSNPLWWVFIIPACSMALHMSLSLTDIKNSLKGLAVIVVLWLIVDVIMYFVNINAFLSLTSFCVNSSGFLLNFYMLSVLLSIMLIWGMLAVKGILKIKNKRKVV